MGEYTSISHFTWVEVDCGVCNLAKRSLKKSSGFLKTIDVTLHHKFTVFFYLKICFQYVPVYLCSERDERMFLCLTSVLLNQKPLLESQNDVLEGKKNIDNVEYIQKCPNLFNFHAAKKRLYCIL